MRSLRQAGVPAGVLMAPVMPGLTDSLGSIDAVAHAAEAHGALFFGAAPLRLMPTVKEHYLEFVRDEFPDLLGRYQRAYPGVHAPPDYTSALQQRIHRVRARYRFRRDEVRESPESPQLAERVHRRQLALPM
jgi:DNA repair photolyase